MACEHKHLRCTDCRFYCLECGAEVNPNETPKPEEKPVKTAKRGKKKEA